MPPPSSPWRWRTAVAGLLLSIAAAEAPAVAARPSGIHAAALPARAGPDDIDVGVDPSGSLTISVPIGTVPGIGGTALDLKLAYSSGAGTGFLGVGWKLGGVSQIQRCPATVAVDGFRGSVSFNDKDRFCLDGARLINVAGAYGADGSSYRTEIETWQRVTATGSCGSGPCAFTVQERDGSTLVFGGTADSRAMAGSSVRAWLIDSRTDANGNVVQYSYGADQGSPALARIDYGANPGQNAGNNRAVLFAYEQRPDPISNFVGGINYGQATRLSAITTQVEGVGVASIRLGYTTSQATGRSLLASVQRCSPSQCYNPQTFQWQGQAKPGFVTAALNLGGGLPSNSALQPADLNGDGYGDLIAVQAGNSLTLTPMVYDRSGTFTPCAALTLPGTDPRRIKVGDFNADGIADFALLNDDGQKLSAAIELGQRGSCTFKTVQTQTFAIPAAPDTMWSADVNGDGQTDIVAEYKVRNGVDLEVMLASANGLAAPISTTLTISQCTPGPNCQTHDFLADVNGDGMADFVRFTADGRSLPVVYVALATPTGFLPAVETDLKNMPTSGLLGAWPLDVNRDGLTDLVVAATGPNGVLSLTPFFSDGTGRIVAGQTTNTNSLAANTLFLGPVDSTGTGTPLMLQISGTQPTVTATTFNPIAGIFDKGTAVQTSFGAFAGAQTFAMDFSGDGKADLVQLLPGAGALRIAGLVNAGPPADLIASVTGSAGGTTTVGYAPLSDPSVYSTSWQNAAGQTNAMAYAFRAAPGSEPFQRVSGGVRSVVETLTRASTAGVTLGAYRYAETYAYRDGLIDLTGRGWLGFAMVSRTSLDRGQTTLTQYAQAFPLTGQALAVTLSCDKASSTDPKCAAAADPTLNRATNSYLSQQTATGVTGTPVYAPLLQKVRIDAFAYGQPDFSRERDYSYDAYGNPILLADVGIVAPAKNAAAGDDVYTCKAFSNLVGANQWQLGLLVSRKISGNAACDPNAPFAAGDVHLERWSYDGAGNLATYAIYDDGNAGFLQTSYGYDGFGNQIRTTLPGGAARAVGFDPVLHTYPLTVSEIPAGGGSPHITTYAYDPRFGQLVGRIDLNGATFVTCMDDLGAVTASQGPAPTPGQWQYSPSCLGPSTGPAPMANAPVITTATEVRATDGQGLSTVRTSALERWPLAGETSDFVWRTSYYDGLGRAFMVRAQDIAHPAGTVVCSVLDSAGNAVRTSAPDFSSATSCDSATPTGIVWSTRSLDSYGRPVVDLTGSTVPQQADTKVQYDYQPGLVTATAQGSSGGVLERRITRSGYFNGRRKIVSTAAADGSARTDYDYNPTGELVRIREAASPSNPAGVTSTIGYDSVGRRIIIDNPDQNSAFPNGTAQRRVFSADALLQTVTDAKGQVTRFTYDGYRRPLTRSDPNYVVTYGYDSTASANGAGRLTSITMTTAAGAAVYSETYGYDAYGNITDRRLNLAGGTFALKRGFDPLGNVVAETLPDGGSITRKFAAGMAIEATGPAGLDVTASNYSALRLPQVIGLGANAVSTTGYSAAGTPTGSRVTGAGGAVLLDETLHWDGLFNLNAVTDNLKPGGVDYSETYSYVSGRLTQASAPGTYGALNYDYDDEGNLVSVNGLARGYAAHRVVSVANAGGPATTLAYDAVGNLNAAVTGTQIVQYQFDARNQLTQVTAPSGTMEKNLVFADDGRRLVKQSADGVVTLYPFPDYEVVRAPGLDDIRKTYLSLGGQIYGVADISQTGPPRLLYFQNNQVGNNALVLDGQGNLVARYAYQPYGLPAGSAAANDPGERRFQTHPWDADPKVYDFGARFYDPVLARFLSADDRAADELFKQDSLNRYALSTNNPVTLIDPTGHDIWDNIAGALLGGLEITAGVAIDVASDGALEPIGQGLIGAGIGGIQYSVTAGSNFSWKEYGDQQLVGFAIGAVTGGLGDEGIAGESAVDIVENSAASVTRSVSADVAEDSAGQAVTTDASNAGDEVAMESSTATEDSAEDEVCTLASLPAGMMVETASGLRDIAAIKVDDLVIAQNALDHGQHPRPVGALLGRSVSALTRLTVRYGTATETLLLTANHPVAAVDGRWIKASALRPGMLLVAAKDAPVTVVTVSTAALATPVRVYNLSLAPEHSYFIGKSGLWVHNPCRATEKSGKSKQGYQYDVVLEVPEDEYPQSAQHIKEAQKIHEDVLTIDRAGAKANRRASLRGWATKSGFDRDEYPPAMFDEGGDGAHIKYINPSDNRASGSSFGGQLRDFPDGTRVWFKVVAKIK